VSQCAGIWLGGADHEKRIMCLLLPQEPIVRACPLWVISGQTVLGQNPALSAIVRKRTWSALFAAILALQVWSLDALDRPSTSNKITQKGLASSRRQSGTVSSSGRWLRFGILPRRLLR
jgi:hypothetical protein